MADWRIYDSKGRDNKNPMFAVDAPGHYKVVNGNKSFYEYTRLDKALNKLKELENK